MPIYTPQEININDLVDIQNIVIDERLPVSEKKKEYRKQIKNPECFRFGDTIVRISYAESGPAMKDLLQQYLLSGQHIQLVPQAVSDRSTTLAVPAKADNTSAATAAVHTALN